jgi:hypothetical protein
MIEILENFAAVLHYKLFGCENSRLQFVKNTDDFKTIWPYEYKLSGF